MHRATLILIIKPQKQLKSPLIGEWINNCAYLNIKWNISQQQRGTIKPQKDMEES